MREGAPDDAVRKRRLPRLETIERPAALSHMAHFIEATSHDLSLLNEKLQYQASRDSLTGLRNRGETERLLLACLNETRAIHQPLTVLLLDGRIRLAIDRRIRARRYAVHARGPQQETTSTPRFAEASR